MYYQADAKASGFDAIKASLYNNLNSYNIDLDNINANIGKFYIIRQDRGDLKVRKNKKIIIAIMLVFMVFMSSCKGTKPESDTRENNSEDSTNNAKVYDNKDKQNDVAISLTGEGIVTSLTREDFENINKEYRFDTIIEELGQPSSIEGSGIIYFVWNLTDGTKAYVCFSSDDKIERIEIITPGESNELLYKRQYYD